MGSYGKFPKKWGNWELDMKEYSKLLGLAGPARSGKDTAGQAISWVTGWKTYALASPIKETINDLFDWDGRHAYGELKEIIDPNWGFSPRQAYQLFGTEFGRSLREDLWLRMAYNKYEKLGSLIITDIRFENEADLIRDNGGHIIHIQRKDCMKVNAHASEIGIKVKEYDSFLHNDGTVEDFQDSVKKLISEMRFKD